ncbi:MAG TPA: hypothetical protein VF456_24080 [Vicinamibacterales bacterium]
MSTLLHRPIDVWVTVTPGRNRICRNLSQPWSNAYPSLVTPPVGGAGNPVVDMLSAVPGGFIGIFSEVNYNIWTMDLPR